MNKLIGLLAILFLINACDDGDVAVQDIKFEDVTGAACGKIVYKIKGNEALLLKIESDTAFKNDQTKLNEPRIYAINPSNQVIYRAYNGAVSSDNFCATPPATKPDNTEEWIATGGTIEITTTINKTINATTNASTIVGYNHFVQFKNITFRKPSGDQFYDVYNFGTYKTTNITPINLTFPNTVTLCTTGANNIITNRIGTVALLSYDNNPNNLSATIGVKTAAISTTNKLFYRTFLALDVNNYLCNAAFGTGSTIEKEWVATTGSVEITTENNAGALKHTINLKGVTLKNGNSDFYLGDDFNAGEYLN